ncbi:hypothetical protein HK101_006975 [Irineochytrium annulatum]|nr:hypothetical protein HK101_006975 [Irineochytrium annulatum]
MADGTKGLYVYSVERNITHFCDFTILESTVIPSDFAELDEANGSLIAAVTDFCYLVDTGNLDVAFRITKTYSYQSLERIENDRVWKNLAKICVKKGRLDVAVISLSNIGHATAINALRRAGPEASLTQTTSIIATFLGMHEDIENLYLKSGRYDLLNIFYQVIHSANEDIFVFNIEAQDCGLWDKALEVASKFDRINLRTTYFKFGRYLLEIGDKIGAAAAFEKSGSHCIEIPQSLVDSEAELRVLVSMSNDKHLRRWWGQYEESRGNFADALKFYNDADDVLSMVRVHCFCGNLGPALDLSRRSENPAAAYYIARQYEKDNKISEAIEFYTLAKCFIQAIRLAKTYKLTNQLINLALQGPKNCMVDVAMYFESSAQNLDKAITLYHRAGQTSKAIEMCFQTKQFSILEEIAQNLGPDSDPALLSRCAAFFNENKQYEKAVKLLAHAKMYQDAAALCLQKNVTLTEEIADEISGPAEDSHINQTLLLQVAELCLSQRSYHLACKKFAQGGDRIKAMKALLKSGDVERIIFFANVSGPKQKEIFIVAANFLQTLDWRNNPQVMKAIITFYTKSKAYESLGGFYEACCQVEIDEYQNYDKALAALREALKCLTKAKDSVNVQAKQKALANRIAFTEMFVNAKRLARTNAAEMFKICGALLEEGDAEQAIRVGDIFALMIESHYASGDLKSAEHVLEMMKMRVSAANLEYYLDADVLRILGGNQQQFHYDQSEVPEEEFHFDDKK